MKQITVFCAYIFCAISLRAQVGINNPNPDSSSALDIKSNKKGILIPRLTSVERVAINKPADGLMVYDNTLQQYSTYSNNQWQVLNPWQGKIGNNEDVYLNNVGEVGIGTTSPQNTLHLKGKSNNDVSLMLQPASWNSTNDYGTIYFGDNGHYIRGQWGEGTTIFDANQTRIMGGNVGIGTTAAPNYKLEVNGTLGLFRPSDGTNAGVFEFGTDLNNSWRIVERANNQNSYEIYRNDNGSRKGPFLSINPVTSIIGIRNSLVVDGKLTVGDSLVVNGNAKIKGKLNADQLTVDILGGGLTGVVFTDQNGKFFKSPFTPITGKMTYFTFHNFNLGGFLNSNSIVWIPTPTADPQDDWVVANNQNPVSLENRGAAWVMPFGGILKKVVVHVGNNSGRVPAATAKIVFVKSSRGIIENGFYQFTGNYNSTSTTNCNYNFNQNDYVAIGFDATDSSNCPNGDCYMEDTNYSVTCVWELDVN